MAIATPTLTKSIIALGFGLSVPLALHKDNAVSVIAGFMGGAVAGTVIAKSFNSDARKQSGESKAIASNPFILRTVKAVADEEKIESSGERIPVAKCENILISLLEQRGIGVIQHRQPQLEDELFDPIAKYLGKNYSLLEKVHRRIKASISRKSNFSYHLYGKSQQEIQSCTQYCNNLYRATLLSHYHYDRRKKIIYGTVQRRGDILQFLNGGWFERAIFSQVREIFPDREVEYLLNPHLRFSNGDRFELDLLFVVDEEIFWIECKTGNNYNDCLPRYSQHRQVLGIDKDRSFLVGLGLSDLDAERWTKLWSISVVNPSGLSNLLTLKEKGTIPLSS